MLHTIRCLRARLRALRDDTAGIVLTEFAIWVSVLFVAMMVGLDFGGYYIARGSVNEAISAAAVKAFGERDEADFSGLVSYVRNMAEDPDLEVTISCNGTSGSCTNTDRTCACLKTDGSYVAATCGDTCTGSDMTTNSVAGYYLTIRAQKTYTPVLVPDGILSEAAISQATTVRLE